MTILKLTKPTARKTHQCEFCQEEISVGEKYSYQFLTDGHGRGWAFKSHLLCQAFMEKMEHGVNEHNFDRDGFKNHVEAEYRERYHEALHGAKFDVKVDLVLTDFASKNTCEFCSEVSNELVSCANCADILCYKCKESCSISNLGYNCYED